MVEVKSDKVIGFYNGPDVIRPIFGKVDIEDFKVRYPGREPVLESHLADDEDYVPDPEEESVEWN
jgi:hypothetical protein